MDQERDAIVFFGMLARLFQTWDAPIPIAASPLNPTHSAGMNIIAAIVDERDGELLALEQNAIHRDASPLQHAEIAALHTALEKLKAKNPHDPARATMEDYVRDLFKYCTLYTSLEPCPMCASTLLMCGMNRVVFVAPDSRFSGSWASLNNQFFRRTDLSCEQFSWTPAETELSRAAAASYRRMLEEFENLRKRGIPDPLYFDHLYAGLKEIYETFSALKLLDTTPENHRTFQDLKKRCGM